MIWAIRSGCCKRKNDNIVLTKEFIPSTIQIVYKLNSLKRQIHFIASTRKKVLVGLILCIYLDFIIIALQPFDTDQFQADNRFLLLSGFGVVMFIVFVIHSSIENRWYSRVGKVWLVSHELFSTLVFCLFLGTVVYFYNTIVVNGNNCTLESYWRYLRVTVAYMLPVLIPLMLYLRQKFGERIIPPAENFVVLTGENKNEVLRLNKEELLYIKAVENYVEICFIDESKKVISKTFRQTLSNVSSQVPFLEKCHRSYLVNMLNVAAIFGNSQSATISFLVGVKEIPLSKTYYKDIKNRML